MLCEFERSVLNNKSFKNLIHVYPFLPLMKILLPKFSETIARQNISSSFGLLL